MKTWVEPEDEFMVQEIVMIWLGMLVTLVGVFAKSFYDRQTYSSNQLFEIRIKSLNEIWAEFNRMKSIFAQNIPLGFELWKEKYESDARKALASFRESIDNSQVILSEDVIEGFRKIDQEYFLYLEEKEQSPAEFHAKVKSLLDRLSGTVNESMATGTHKIGLRFRT